NLPQLDAIVIGEGEYTTLELIKRLEKAESLSGLEGVWFRQKDGQIVSNPRRKPIEKLDALPFPSRDFLSGKTHALISSSRGCIGHCTFCNERNLLNYGGKIWRGRSPENVVDEIESIVKGYGINDFVFSDSSFEDPGTLGLKRIGEIAEKILERGLKIYFTCYIRADTIKESELGLLRLLNSAGLCSVFTGVEAGCDSMLKLFGKRASVTDNEASIELFKKTAIYQRIGFIMFTPETTLQDIEDNVRFLIRTGFCYDLQKTKSVLGVYQTSSLHKYFSEKGLIEKTISYRKPTSFLFEDNKAELTLTLLSQLKDHTPYELLHAAESVISKSFVHYSDNNGLQAFRERVNRFKAVLNDEYGRIVLEILDLVRNTETSDNSQKNLRLAITPFKEIQHKMVGINRIVEDVRRELEDAWSGYIMQNSLNEEFMQDIVKKQHHGVLQAINRTKSVL
ncbi:MAG TPA: radical SAM protein, partial [Ruminiclostridium sp.]|nr:radical SAM protein [Ruminiclostridium sp.]